MPSVLSLRLGNTEVGKHTVILRNRFHLAARPRAVRFLKQNTDLILCQGISRLTLRTKLSLVWDFVPTFLTYNPDRTLLSLYSIVHDFRPLVNTSYQEFPQYGNSLCLEDA